MMHSVRKLGFALASFALVVSSARADVTRDGKIGPATAPPLTTDGKNFVVKELHGELRGQNLFHSFASFDLAAGQSVSFEATSPVRNVIGRITGRGASSVDGLIRSRIDGANLILMNPHGFLFGPSAQLDVSGSFTATSADFTEFGADRREALFADPDRASSPLSVADPTSFGFLAGPIGPIELSGSRLLQERGDLELIGGDLKVTERARLLAPDHRLLLISAAQQGRVRLEPGDPRAVPDVSEFGMSGLGSIALDGGLGAGTIATRSGPLSVLRGGLEATGVGEGIDIASSGVVQLNGDVHALSDSDRRLPIRIQASTVNLGEGGEVYLEWEPESGVAAASGNAGAGISLDVGRLHLSEGGSLGASVTGQGTGAAGSIRVDADDAIWIVGGDDPSEIFAITSRDTNGASIELNAAKAVRIGRRAEVGVFFLGASGGAELGGNLKVDTDRLIVTDGGRLSVGAKLSVPTGVPVDAGDIAIDARSVLISGSEGARRSGLFSGDNSGGGRGGDIRITARNLRVTDGAQISAQASDGGPAGEIKLEVDNTWIERAAIQTRAPSGDGGAIRIARSSRVVVRDSEIRTDGGGSGGDIEVNSELIAVERSTISANAGEEEGGNVDLTAQFLVRDALSKIEATSERGVSGTVAVSAPELSLVGELADLPAAFLAARELLPPRCAVRHPESTGSLVVTAPGGVADSLEGWLIALDVDEELLPSVAQGGGESERRVEAQAVAAFQADDLVSAARGFAAVGASSNAGARARGLRGTAQVQQASGAFRESLGSLLQALLAAEEAGDLPQAAAVLGSLGNAYVALGQPALAEGHFRRGVAVARRAQASAVAARILNNLGNHLGLQGQPERALAAYREAWELARGAGQPLYAAEALANGARAALQSGSLAAASELLAEARAEIDAVRGTQGAVFARIHSARTELLLADRDPADEPLRLQRAHADLSAAVTLAAELGSERAFSYAAGNLGMLYERERRHEEALHASQRALLAAQQANAPEAEYRWHAQSGWILSQLGRRADAIEAYRRAVAVAEKLRLATAPGYARAEGAFWARVAPVYLTLVDLLLREAAADAGAPETGQALLRDARTTVEALKLAELRDYFRDECAAELQQQSGAVDTISPRAAVIYPILLADRTVLLVSRAGSLRPYELPVGAEAVAEQVRRLRGALEDGSSETYLAPAQQLYDWLVAPFAADVERADVDTLVFVPYGVLRTIPMAALHDGADFLVQRFGLALTASLSLTAPRALDSGELKLLAAGLSEGVQGFPELPHAAEEVRAIEAMYGGTLLLDGEFTHARIGEALSSEVFSVVHIASHTSFGEDAGQSFILTHDGLISMREIGQWVRGTRFRDDPLELIVLSACETAAGDPAAALGLAGVAVQSGARSALGSLWKIDDEAAKDLIVEFYAQLREKGQTRSGALRSAQLALLERSRYRHPRFWSAFVLMGSWL